MNYRGDIRLGDTLDFKFCTVQSTGAPTTLAGTPSVACYAGNSTTEITAGITLTVDFDARTGLNNVRIVASGGNGYATATNYDVVITAGTVNSVSAVGYVVGSFSIENRSALMPTTAARTLDVSTTGEAGLDWANIGSPTTAVNLSGTRTLLAGAVAYGTAQAVTGTTIRLASAETFADDELIGATVVILSATTGAGQSRVITDYASATDTCTVDTWTTTPTGTIVYAVYPTAPSSTTAPAQVDVRQWNGTAVTTPNTAGTPVVDLGRIAGTTVSTTTAQLGVNVVQVSGDSTAADNLEAATDGTGYNIGGGSVVAASVTGNVGGTVNGLTATAQGNVRTAVGLASANLDTQLDALPTAAENAAAVQASATATPLSADIQRVNGVTLNGDGSGTPWGP